MQKFDFEEWKTLAETDPAAFEVRRQQELDALITAAPSHRQRRLRGLQWRINIERSRHKDPRVSCEKAFEMMWQSVYSEHGLLQALNSLPGDNQALPRKQAQILAFQGLMD